MCPHAIIYLGGGGEDAADEWDAGRARALSDLQHAAALAPANVRVLVAQAEVMPAEEAEDILERAYCLAPGDARVVTALAEVCHGPYLCVLIRLVYTCGARGAVTASMCVCAHHTIVYTRRPPACSPACSRCSWRRKYLCSNPKFPRLNLGLSTVLKTGYESGCLCDLSTVGNGWGGFGKTYFYSMCGAGAARGGRAASADLQRGGLLAAVV